MPHMPAFSHLLVVLASAASLRSLFAQLAIFLATMWENILHDQESTGTGQQASIAKTNKTMASQCQMHLGLAKHMNATQVYCNGRAPLRFVPICIDKSSAGGLPLHNTFVNVNGQGVAMFAFSQVPFGGATPRTGAHLRDTLQNGFGSHPVIFVVLGIPLLYEALCRQEDIT